MFLRSILILSSIAVTAGWAQTPPPPESLKVVSATSKTVQLAWNASDRAKYYVIQRKPLLVTSSGIRGTGLEVSPGDYSQIIAIENHTAIDDTVDPYGTYSYCVAAVNDLGQSGCSNEVTAGPPPFGFNIAVPIDANADSYSYRDLHTLVRMEIDGNGDPAMTYVDKDPNRDGNNDDDTLFFVSWNRAQYAWNPPVQVAVTGGGNSGGTTVPISLARDAATDMWGIAYELREPSQSQKGVTLSRMMLATSTDGGFTWKYQSLTGDAADVYLYEPALALWQGSFYFAYLFHRDEFRLATGKLANDPAKWTVRTVPLPAGYPSILRTISLALDSEHNPGLALPVRVAYGERPDLTGIVFWRPMSNDPPVLVAHDDGRTSGDQSDIALSFFGTEPRIASDVILDYAAWDRDYDHCIWAFRAADNGRNWLPPVNVASDRRTTLEGPLSMTTGSQGQTAIATSTDWRLRFPENCPLRGHDHVPNLWPGACRQTGIRPAGLPPHTIWDERQVVACVS
jgi:hypothetical protein